jgi:hypothetical protein
MENWKFHDINFENQTKKIGGVDIWKHKWEPSELNVFQAPHPQYPNQTHNFEAYTINELNFAASEVSNMVWCIYVLK